MKIHHLDCGSMRFPGVSLVSHVLLIETGRELVLVDTGFGLGDIADPSHRLGSSRLFSRPALVAAQTAIRQIEARGLDPRDVRHIVLTHGDSDHAGGLSDFPWASVHMAAEEARAVHERASFRERQRYSAAQWAHAPSIVAHAPGTEQWRGFTGVTALEEIDPDILLVPLIGHSRGHAGVAVRGDTGWVLHAGDAFYQLTGLTSRHRQPAALRMMGAFITFNRDMLRENQERLAELHEQRDTALLLVNGHDPELFAAACATHHDAAD